MPGGMELVRSMASFVPSQRPTMLEVMKSKLFASLRETAVGAGGGGRERCLEFMAFARGEGEQPLKDI